MKKTIGFIGSGNMGGAIIGGLVGSALVAPNQVIVSSQDNESLQSLKDQYAIRIADDNRQVAAEADILFLAVKPNIYNVVIDEIKTTVKEKIVIVTIAAGKSLSDIEERFGRKLKVVRAMPNTPALVGEGMTGICANEVVNVAELTDVKNI
ncbi:MAG TPA: NAD(P)-binding domain-containing protein, partial [Trichococcus flocculiformis]|nr:NAD(P)-binding domain-containing protein [Trichococcus flocculiformis]